MLLGTFIHRKVATNFSAGYRALNQTTSISFHEMHVRRFLPQYYSPGDNELVNFVVVKLRTGGQVQWASSCEGQNKKLNPK
jgi:hypothetical protein